MNAPDPIAVSRCKPTAADCATIAAMTRALEPLGALDNASQRTARYIGAGFSYGDIIAFDDDCLRAERARRTLFPGDAK